MTIEIADSPFILLEDDSLFPLRLELSLSCSTQAVLQAQLSPLMSAIAEKSAALASGVLKQLPDDHWLNALGMRQQIKSKALQWTLVLVSDEEIKTLNELYRQKPTATDVLSFPALEVDDLPEGVLSQLEVLELGDIYISLDWAKVHAQPEYAQSPLPVLQRYTNVNNVLDETGLVVYYIAERFLHGTLHLLGQHHDTMEDFNVVKAIQDSVLQRVFLSP